MATKRTASETPAVERPSTEVRPPQNTLTAAQKLAILADYEALPRGDARRGELLRRHGLYSSHMSKWREQRDRGRLSSHTQPAAGRPALPRDPQVEELARLRAENTRLQAELDKAQFVIAIQKKVATLLGEASASPVSAER
jgi:transposase